MHGAAYKHVPSVVHFLAEKGAKDRGLESAEQERLDAAQDRRRRSAGDEHRQLAPDGRDDPRRDGRGPNNQDAAARIRQPPVQPATSHREARVRTDVTLMRFPPGSLIRNPFASTL